MQNRNSTGNAPPSPVRRRGSDVDRLTGPDRIGFGAGDLAQNLVYTAVGSYLLFFYTDVVGLAPAVAATLFFVVQLADAFLNPFVGVFLDRHNPPWGKYRSYLLLAGIPLAIFTVLCFLNPFDSFGVAWKALYAYAAYAGFTLLFTFANIAYGALNASLSRDTGEITLLTAVRSVATGKSFISPEVKGLLAFDPPVPTLSPRQQEVLTSMVKGFNNTEIASQLGISRAVVKEHVETLLVKLGASNRTEAVAIALRKHLVEA